MTDNRIAVTDFDRRKYPYYKDDEILWFKTTKRVEALKAMDFLARSSNDELCVEYWLQEGVADGDGEDVRQLLTYAQDNDTFKRVCKVFVFIMSSDEMQEGGLYFDMG